MIALKKKAKFFDFDDYKVFAKHVVDAWVIKPGKGGTGEDEPGICLLIATDLEHVEIKLLRSEVNALVDETYERYPEFCDCGGCQ